MWGGTGDSAVRVCVGGTGDSAVRRCGGGGRR